MFSPSCEATTLAQPARTAFLPGGPEVPWPGRSTPAPGRPIAALLSQNPQAISEGMSPSSGWLLEHSWEGSNLYLGGLAAKNSPTRKPEGTQEGTQEHFKNC